jgi:hypothetical protein
MLQITRRTLFILNLGIALVFVAIGLVSEYTLSISRPTEVGEMPAFRAAIRKAIVEERDLEALRVKAAFYFDLARDLRTARSQDSERMFYDARLLAFVVAALFAAVGLMLFLLPDAPAAKPVKPAETPA